MDGAAKPVFRGRSGDGAGLAGGPDIILRNQIDGEALHRSGVRFAVASLWPPFRLRPNVDVLGESVRQLRGLDRFVQTTPGFAVARDPEAARGLIARGYLTVLPAVEGGEGIRTVEEVDVLWAAGARLVTLVHFGDNAIGGAAYGQVPPGLFDETKRTERGLTDTGRAVVERMMALGMIIDLAHASDRTMADVLALTEKRGVPVVYSHAGARALRDSERNLGDELAKRIVAGGGIIGVTAFEHYLENVPEGARLPEHAHGTCDDQVAHWLHFAKLVGPEHVTLGSDFNGFVKRTAAGGKCPDGLRHVGDLGAFYAALESAGISREAIDGGGERLLTLWDRVESAADPQARARASQVAVPEYRLLESPL